MLNVPWKLSNLLIQGHFKSRYDIFLFTWVIIQDYTKVSKFLFHLIPGSAFVNLLLKKGNSSKHSARKSKLVITLSMKYSITLQLTCFVCLDYQLQNWLQEYSQSVLEPLEIKNQTCRRASLIHCCTNLRISYYL